VKHCPECGQKLAPKVEGAGAINIGNTSGDVLGTEFSGSGNITGKKVEYIVNRNTIHIHIGDNRAREVLDTLQRTMAVPTQVEQTSAFKNTASTTEEDIKAKIQESTNTQEQIKNVLEELNKIEENTGTEIKEIKAGELKISKNDLSVKEIILKANEHYWKNEYNEAIKCYDVALERDTNNPNVWHNRGYALNKLSRHEEAIKCYDKAIEIDPNFVKAWENKGVAFYRLGKYDEAIKCYDKAIEITEIFYVRTLNKKGAGFANLGV
jgi:tetratricopeptide (TPR) repeat protein